MIVISPHSILICVGLSTVLMEISSIRHLHHRRCYRGAVVNAYFVVFLWRTVFTCQRISLNPQNSSKNCQGKPILSPKQMVNHVCPSVGLPHVTLASSLSHTHTDTHSTTTSTANQLSKVFPKCDHQFFCTIYSKNKGLYL